jgi:hypothetical protein
MEVKEKLIAIPQWWPETRTDGPTVSRSQDNFDFDFGSDRSIPIRPCGGGLEYLHRNPTIHKRRKKGTQYPGYNRATLFMGEINTATWPFGLGVS